jgi:hypothetical protein
MAREISIKKLCPYNNNFWIEFTNCPHTPVMTYYKIDNETSSATFYYASETGLVDEVVLSDKEFEWLCSKNKLADNWYNKYRDVEA